MNPVSLLDMEQMAESRVSHNTWAYISGSAADGITLRRNREAFHEITMRPRLLADLNGMDLSTTVLGDTITFPVMIAPAWGRWFVHPDGELAVARAAGAAGTIMAASFGTPFTVDEIAAAASGPLWYQLHHVDEDVTEYLVRRAAAAGYSTVCLTIDGVGNAPLESNIRNELQVPSDFGDLRKRPDLLAKLRSGGDGFRGMTWSRLGWLKSRTDMHLVIKGVLTPEDARLCVENGVDGIVVSNHGGRVLDTSPATIDVLPSIVDAVDGKAEVYLDSGIRRGTDVFKALALGARAVLVGRPVFWGLALDGEKGVKTMLEMLRSDFEKSMRFSGKTSIDQLDDSLVGVPR
jgi:isopentenyl diphosphate isomerase/L-lactate dehydrogenase-like FMN-dependent dehydrogenase